jgi:NTP pyrophosphatase (non-canonical NTP hydrolase)
MMKDERLVRFVVKDPGDTPIADRSFVVDCLLDNSMAFTYYDMPYGNVRHVQLDIQGGRDNRQFDLNRMPNIARELADALTENGFAERESIQRQCMGLTEEVGEFVGSLRRWLGMARRSDTREHVLEEWADVIITAFVTGIAIGMTPREMTETLESKLDVIFSRGWREENADLESGDEGSLPSGTVSG